MRNVFIIYLFTLISVGYGQYFLGDFTKYDRRNFTKIEKHVHRESNKLNSVEAIANSINQVSSSNLEKVYATFYWVSYTLTYDMLAFKAKVSIPYSPKEVLRTKLAVCNGYSNLFKAICEELKIEAVVINGYSKGYNYVEGSSFEVCNHAWNGVKIRNKWFLLDATWASPNNNTSINNSGVVDNSYFLASPQLFVTDHLPEDPSWQFLSPIITLDLFEKNKSEVLKHSEISLIINDKVREYCTYNDVAQQEVALRQRISNFNPKNKTAVYRLGVAVMYQALDILESLNQLDYNNVLEELPNYKYRFYELLDKAVFHFRGAVSNKDEDIAKSAQTFLDETIYQKGVFNYEAAQIIFDSISEMERTEALLLQEIFNLMITQYLDIALIYFQFVPIHSWYRENAESYILTINDTRTELLIK